VTFNNGGTYFEVSEVKETIGHFDTSEYDYADDLATILSF
jgi:hypothetical protein